MKLIVGIGNPGPRYDKTRHNIGFQAVDVLKNRWSGTKTPPAVALIKPETFVNNSGDAVRALVQKHSAVPSDFLFLCDDVNLAFGKLRLRGEGSSGGHHGLESVIEAFGSETFARLRLGVGNALMPADDLTDFVLGRFTAEEESRLGIVLDKAASVCESWIQDGFEGAGLALSRLQSNVS